MFFANYTLDNATAQAARMIRTGQVQAQNLDAAAFQQEVCKNVTPLLPCGKLKLDVRRFSNFNSAEITDPFDSSGNLKTKFSYDPGQGGDVVVVRAFYPWDIPALLPNEISLANMKDARLLMSTAAFRNEPFQTTTPSTSK